MSWFPDPSAAAANRSRSEGGGRAAAAARRLEVHLPECACLVNETAGKRWRRVGEHLAPFHDGPEIQGCNP